MRITKYVKRELSWIGRIFIFLISALIEIGIFVCAVGYAQGLPTTSQITQYGITWYFDREYEYGQFANGDYWVIGPVTITRITPDAEVTVYEDAIVAAEHCESPWSSTNNNNCSAACAPAGPEFASYCDTFTHQCYCSIIKNGWEVNPIYEGGQGFDTGADRVPGGNPELIPSLPYVASANESVVKGLSYSNAADCGGWDNCLRTAAVLTVVAQAPPNNGAGVFRPPYVGDTKPYYYVGDLRTDRLPQLEPVNNTPTIAALLPQIQRLQLDHKPGQMGGNLHPIENMPFYGSGIGTRNNDIVLRLMLNDPLPTKMPLLTAFVQYGLDLYYMMLIGQTWPLGGGHRPGQKLPLVFTAALFDQQDMQDRVQQAAFFSEEITLKASKNGMPIWGLLSNNQEDRYWNFIMNPPSYNIEYTDPYGYIDGGMNSTRDVCDYQTCCTSMTWKGSVLAVLLMEAMRPLWNDELVINYADRWVNIGVWTQPDPCAPYDGNPDHYGITFGPDGHGDCIKDANASDGIGRFPAYHGRHANTGGYYSTFQSNMWNAYRGPTCYDRICEGDETYATCPYDCPSSYILWTR